MGLKGPTMCTREGKMAGAGSWRMWEEGEGERRAAKERVFPARNLLAEREEDGTGDVYS